MWCYLTNIKIIFFVALDVSEEFVKLEEDFHYWSIGCKSFTLMKELSDRPSLIGFILAKEALSIDCKNVHGHYFANIKIN